MIERIVWLKVKVTKAKEKSYWYSEHIGKTFYVRDSGDGEYIVKHGEMIKINGSEYSTGLLLIDYDDCEVIK